MEIEGVVFDYAESAGGGFAMEDGTSDTFRRALDLSLPDLSVIGPSNQQKLRHFLDRMLSIRLNL